MVYEWEAGGFNNQVRFGRLRLIPPSQPSISARIQAIDPAFSPRPREGIDRDLESGRTLRRITPKCMVIEGWLDRPKTTVRVMDTELNLPILTPQFRASLHGGFCGYHERARSM